MPPTTSCATRIAAATTIGRTRTLGVRADPASTARADGNDSFRTSGPPPPRPTRPVTARFDTSDTFRRRDATTTNGSHGLRGHRPISARERAEDPEPLRASQPNGPVRTRRTRRRAPLPSLDESLTTELEFGKFRGHTLGQVAAFEPTYIDWIARTITRDRDLVVKARVIQSDLDERGVERRVRPPTPGFGGGRGPDDSRARTRSARARESRIEIGTPAARPESRSQVPDKCGRLSRRWPARWPG